MNAFCGNPLDRCSRERLDEAWLDAALADASSRFLAFARLDVLVKKDGSGLAWARRGLLEKIGKDACPVLLGRRDGVAHFAVDASSLAQPAADLGLGAVADFVDVRAVAGQLAAEDTGIVAQARALVDWHATHPFCARCGAATEVAQGGAMRRCPRCKAEHFPRVNPVVIMLVVRGDRALLGRQAAWPRGMYSTLAGFVEAGETIEEAVRREVLEEAGIAVGEVRYHSSQPWPFPSSLMIGCVAEALGDDIVVDEHELDDARWVDRATMAAACRGESGADGLWLPPPMAIGRTLCDAWVGIEG